MAEVVGEPCQQPKRNYHEGQQNRCAMRNQIVHTVHTWTPRADKRHVLNAGEPRLANVTVLTWSLSLNATNAQVDLLLHQQPSWAIEPIQLLWFAL
jgi:hypothetical protein